MHKNTIALMLVGGAVGLALLGGKGKIVKLIAARRSKNRLRAAVDAARDHLLRLGLSRHMSLHR